MPFMVLVARTGPRVDTATKRIFQFVLRAEAFASVSEELLSTLVPDVVAPRAHWPLAHIFLDSHVFHRFHAPCAHNLLARCRRAVQKRLVALTDAAMAFEHLSWLVDDTAGGVKTGALINRRTFAVIRFELTLRTCTTLDCSSKAFARVEIVSTEAHADVHPCAVDEP